MCDKRRKRPTSLPICCCCCCSTPCYRHTLNGPLTPVDETMTDFLTHSRERSHGDSEMQNGDETQQSIHKSFSKSASDLPRFRSCQRSSGDGSPLFGAGETRQRRTTHPGRSKITFITTLKNMLGPGKNKDKRKATHNLKNYSQPYNQEWPSDSDNGLRDSPSLRRKSGSTSVKPESGADSCYLVPSIVDEKHSSAYSTEAQQAQARCSRVEESSSAKDLSDPKVKALRQHSFFQLHVHLKRGSDLVPRDACGTSDPYVKFKVGGKVVFKSKTVYKDLNPLWDETFVVGIEDPFEPVQIKVFDYDWGLQDDFMGMATIDLSGLELNTAVEKTVVLQEPGKHEYMGTVTLTLTLIPKSQEEKEQYLQRGGSRLQEQQRRLKSQIWSSVVTIVLVKGKNLPVLGGQGGVADPYVKFRLGNEKYKSKVELRTVNPKWLEQFDFHLFEDQSQLLEISVWDKDPRSKDDFIGRCTLDLRAYERESTHEVWVDLEGDGDMNIGNNGKLFLLLTISGTTSSASISDLITYKENPHEIRAIKDRYKLIRSFHNLRDVGLLVVKVFKAQGLAAADFGVGKSDPFCVLELVNSRLQTQTEYKTLTPSWNKIFTFDVKDIHSVLEVTVYDEDRDHKVDFLGKMAIPLLRIRNGEKKWYALKDKKLRLRAKGNHPEILLECSVYWNHVRAAIQTIEPKEEKYMQVEPKFKRQIFVRNVNRVKAAIMDIYEAGLYVKSCFEWESPFRSIVAFVLFVIITYYFEAYMLPAFLLLLFFKNYIVISIVGSRYPKDEEAESSANEDEIDEDEKDKEEKKSLKERLQAIQEVIATVQNAIGYIASISESIKNTFNFTVPFLSWLMVIALVLGMAVLYFIPIRFLVLLWGINKFSRKLIRPHSVVNNELADFLSRVPDDEELKDYREIRPTNAQPHEERKRDGKKKKI